MITKKQIKINQQISVFKYMSIALIFAYLASNAYFGWNEEPQSLLEENFDNLLKFIIGVLIGLFIKIVIDYIEFWTNVMVDKTNE